MGRRTLENRALHLTTHEATTLRGLKKYAPPEGMHGWELRKKLKLDPEMKAPPRPTLYRALSRLFLDGLVERVLAERNISEGWLRPPRQYFRITDAGEEALRRLEAASQ